MSLSSALSGLDDASSAYAYENDRPARGAGPGRGKGGGRNRAGGGGDTADGRAILVSKKMSYLLRHGAGKEGVKMDEGGWVNVGDLLNWRNMKSMKVTFAEVQDVVETNSKKRFELDQIPPAPSTPSAAEQKNTTLDVESSDTPLPTSIAQLHISPSSSSASNSTSEPSHYRIRAVQGHSLPVESSALLQPLDPEDASTPRYVMHGTTPAAWTKIQNSGGLSKMGRGHVHTAVGTGDADGDRAIFALIASDETENEADADAEAATAEAAATSRAAATATAAAAAAEEERASGGGPDGAAPVTVIAGRRPTRTVLIWVDVRRSAREGGLKWWRSNNGVILSEGDAKGMIPLEYVAVVEVRRKIVQGKKRDEWERVVVWRQGREVEGALRRE